MSANQPIEQQQDQEEVVIENDPEPNTNEQADEQLNEEP